MPASNVITGLRLCFRNRTWMPAKPAGTLNWQTLRSAGLTVVVSQIAAIGYCPHQIRDSVNPTMVRVAGSVPYSSPCSVPGLPRAHNILRGHIVPVPLSGSIAHCSSPTYSSSGRHCHTVAALTQAAGQIILLHQQQGVAGPSSVAASSPACCWAPPPDNKPLRLRQSQNDYAARQIQWLHRDAVTGQADPRLTSV